MSDIPTPEFVDTAEHDEALQALLAAEEITSPPTVLVDAVDDDVEVIPDGWHRADLDDLPPLGLEITSVQYPADTRASVIIYPRLRVEVAMVGKNGTTVWGPMLQYHGDALDTPGRPKVISGRRAIFWRPYADVSS